jgi:hypothetical protein
MCVCMECLTPLTIAEVESLLLQFAKCNSLGERKTLFQGTILPKLNIQGTHESHFLGRRLSMFPHPSYHYYFNDGALLVKYPVGCLCLTTYETRFLLRIIDT